MARLTPSIGASGIYALLTPFDTRPLTTYTCKAIRSFDDIYKLNEDVFTRYYEPFGITEADFNLDKAAGALIITLMANVIGVETDENDIPSIIYVPDSYILKFPDGSDVPYSHMVLSASLGPLPDYLDLTDIMADVSNILSDKIGITPVVHQHKALSAGVITQVEHDIAETGRQAAIINRETTYSQLLQKNQLYDDLLARYLVLQAAYITLVGP